MKCISEHQIKLLVLSDNQPKAEQKRSATDVADRTGFSVE